MHAQSRVNRGFHGGRCRSQAGGAGFQETLDLLHLGFPSETPHQPGIDVFRQQGRMAEHMSFRCDVEEARTVLLRLIMLEEQHLYVAHVEGRVGELSRSRRGQDDLVFVPLQEFLQAAGELEEQADALMNCAPWVGKTRPHGQQDWPKGLHLCSFSSQLMNAILANEHSESGKGAEPVHSLLSAIFLLDERPNGLQVAARVLVQNLEAKQVEYAAEDKQIVAQILRVHVIEGHVASGEPRRLKNLTSGPLRPGMPSGRLPAGCSPRRVSLKALPELAGGAKLSGRAAGVGKSVTLRVYIGVRVEG